MNNTRKNRWTRYNRFRQAHPAKDAAKRQENAEIRRAEFVVNYSVRNAAMEAPKLGPPFAKIRIDFASGRCTTLTVRETPFGLTKSATRCGSWVAREIQFEQARESTNGI